MVALVAAVNMYVVIAAGTALAKEPGGTVSIVALGDSLTAGYGLEQGRDLASVLNRLLAEKGLPAKVANAGVSGDTTAGGLARLDWAVPEGTDAVIVALGANDMLRGLPVEKAQANLAAIIGRLEGRGIPVLIAGMRASRNLGDAYANAFDRIYPELAEKYGALLYPFLLAGVVLDPKLNLADGMHPNAEGVEVIAKRLLASVEELIEKVRAKKGG
jgi:acyl-CoA thioesterase-1